MSSPSISVMNCGYGVQLRLDLAPVVVRPPIARECLDRGELHALRVVRDRFPLGPPCRVDAPAQFGEIRLRKIHMKRTDGNSVTTHLLRHLIHGMRLLGNRWLHSGVTANVHNPGARMPGAPVGLYCAVVARFDLLVSMRMTAARETQAAFNHRVEGLCAGLGAVNLGSVEGWQRESESRVARPIGVRPQACAVGVDAGQQIQGPRRPTEVPRRSPWTPATCAVAGASSSSARRRAPLAPAPPPARPIGGLAGPPVLRTW